MAKYEGTEELFQGNLSFLLFAEAGKKKKTVQNSTILPNIKDCVNAQHCEGLFWELSSVTRLGLMRMYTMWYHFEGNFKENILSTRYFRLKVLSFRAKHKELI